MCTIICSKNLKSDLISRQIAEIKRAAREAQKSYESDIENMKVMLLFV